MRKTSRMFCTVLLSIIMTVTGVFNASAVEADDLSEGTYSVDAALSCYVNAMGGVEFGTPLLVSSQIDVDSKQNKTMTLNFTKSSVTIYNITCDTFIDINPSTQENKSNVKNGTLGFYDNNGKLQTNSVKYTLSDDTALNSKNEEVNYVSSMTFPLDSIRDTYELTLYVNSNVMGVMFDGSDEADKPATLTVDWSTATEIKEADETSTQSANVKYTVDGGYEVKIPAEITVDPTTKKAEYAVEAQNFVLESGAYVTVTADANGTLTNGSNSLAFTNALESGQLTKTGDKLNGTVTVTDNASVAGDYAGTIDFTINFFAE